MVQALLTVCGGAILSCGLGIYNAELSLSSDRAFPVNTSQAATMGVNAQSIRPRSAPTAKENSNRTRGSVLLVDTEAQSIKPSAIVQMGGNIYLLGPKSVWEVAGGISQLSNFQDLTGLEIKAPETINTVPVQEFTNMAYFPAHDCLIILDKSGDLFEFDPRKSKWHIFRANRPFLPGQPDPQFNDLAVIGNEIALLDPERNNIWKTQGSSAVMQGCFKNILPWRVQPGDCSVGDAVSIAFDGDAYVVKNWGYLTRYGGINSSSYSRQLPFAFRRLPGMRPSRLLTYPGGPLFVVERENNRVLTIDKLSGRAQQFLFARTSDLRGLLPDRSGFWIIDGDQLIRRNLNKPDSFSKHFDRRSFDERLDAFIIPVAGMRLPRHPGVYPGARRLYRYGVHEGLDLFNDAGAKTRINMGTEARAADSGKIIRADANFRDMTLAQFNRVMSECLKQHKTSDHNEDLLRGCQVWIDHGNGVVTRYAHLVKINPRLKVNHFINRGDLIGYIGVSGTGQNLPGRARYPHLHFEIWMDGHYLGYGLTTAETIGVYEDIFGHANE